MIKTELPETSEYGSLTGRLVGIKLWGKRKLTLEPNIGAKRVECSFEDRAVEERAMKSLKRFVEAFGRLHYAKGRKFPRKIDVNEIQVCPESAELPAMKDLHGIAPKITGDLTVEEFLNSVDDWSSARSKMRYRK